MCLWVHFLHHQWSMWEVQERKEEDNQRGRHSFLDSGLGVLRIWLSPQALSQQIQIERQGCWRRYWHGNDWEGIELIRQRLRRRWRHIWRSRWPRLNHFQLPLFIYYYLLSPSSISFQNSFQFAINLNFPFIFIFIFI